MDVIIKEIEARIKMFETVKNILLGPVEKPQHRTRKVSKAGRERIAKAQRKRWRIIKAANKARGR